MAERRPVVAANWKMHKTIAEAGAFLDEFLPADDLEAVELFVCPAHVALAAVAARCDGTPVRVAAQNMHVEGSGAFTGEVSAPMLVAAGADGVILGHSERRQLFGETDDALARKVPVALEAGLVPILCVGETEAERDAGDTHEVLRRQVEADLRDVPAERLAEVVIAYEPVWAIGTGRNATADEAAEAIAHVRSLLSARDAAAAAATRILYGGSVKPGNAAELLGVDGIDGALVGGASLEPESFRAIAEAAA